MNNRRGSPVEIGAVVVAVLMICVLGAVLLGQLGRRAAPPPAVAIVPTLIPVPTSAPPTNAPAPTVAPTDEPTNTPAPTDTPEPTSTPAPTDTPEPSGPTAEESDYAAAVAEQTGALGEALGRIGELTQDARLTDQDWIVDMAIQTVTIEAAHQVLVDHEPVPDSAATLHRALTRATARCADAMDPLRRGIDNRDAELMGQAAQGIKECNGLIQEAKPVLDEWLAAING